MQDSTTQIAERSTNHKEVFTDVFRNKDGRMQRLQGSVTASSEILDVQMTDSDVRNSDFNDVHSRSEDFTANPLEDNALDPSSAEFVEDFLSPDLPSLLGDNDFADEHENTTEGPEAEDSGITYQVSEMTLKSMQLLLLYRSQLQICAVYQSRQQVLRIKRQYRPWSSGFLIDNSISTSC